MNELVVVPDDFVFTGTWQAYDNSYDGLTYQEETGGTDYSWMQIPIGLNLPTNWTISGIEVQFNAGAAPAGLGLLPEPPYGSYCRLDVGLGTNYLNLAGANIKTTADFGGGRTSTNPVALGGSSDAWGLTLTQATLNNTQFSIFVRRSTAASEETTLPRFAIGWTVTVFYTAPGVTLSQTIERTSVHQSSWFGKENPSGTAVATPNRFVAIKAELQPKIVYKEEKIWGDKLSSDQSIMQDSADIAIDGYATYNEIGYLLSSLVSQPNSGLIAGSATANRHTFRLNSLGEDVINTFTMVFGDQVRCHQVTFGQIVELVLKNTVKETTLTAQGIAQNIVDGATMPTGSNEVQTLTFASATGGTFRLMFRKEETADIAWSGTAATLLTNISTALNALPAVSAGSGLVVSGAGPFTVTFSGAGLAGSEQQELTLSKNNLTGAGATITVAEATRGGYTEVSPVKVLPGDFAFYLATTFANLVADQTTRTHANEFHLGGKAKEYWTVNSTNGSWVNTVEEDVTCEMTVTAQAGSEAMGVLADSRNGLLKYARLEAISKKLIDGVNPFRICIDMACKVSSWKPFKDDDGVYATEYVLTAKRDPIEGYSLIITLDNDISGY
jgi:hypothetical protein